MAKYKVGDRVRIVSERPKDDDFLDEMEQFLGKALTIERVFTVAGRAHYFFKEAYPETPFAKMLLDAFRIPGYRFAEDWISGPADEAPEKPLSVHIRFCGNVTVAELLKDGKVVKVESARRNPKDTYIRAEGARVAVERLFAKKDKPFKEPTK